MEINEKNRNIFLAIILIIAFILLFYLIIDWLSGLESSTTGTIIAAFAALVGVLYAQWQAKSREIAEGHREQKIKLYNLYFDIIEEFMDNAKSSNEDINESELPEELKKKFIELNRGLIIWASPKVIRTWLTFRKNAGTDNNINILC
jgi:hypothetical protein